MLSSKPCKYDWHSADWDVQWIHFQKWFVAQLMLIGPAILLYLPCSQWTRLPKCTGLQLKVLGQCIRVFTVTASHNFVCPFKIIMTTSFQCTHWGISIAFLIPCFTQVFLTVYYLIVRSTTLCIMLHVQNSEHAIATFLCRIQLHDGNHPRSILQHFFHGQEQNNRCVFNWWCRNGAFVFPIEFSWDVRLYLSPLPSTLHEHQPLINFVQISKTRQPPFFLNWFSILLLGTSDWYWPWIAILLRVHHSILVEVHR